MPYKPGIAWLPKIVRRWLPPASVFALSFCLHVGTLRGGFVWDDRPAVLDNRDVWTTSPWTDIWRHDFWGQGMADPESHKSFRPLTTLSYRLSNALAQFFSAEHGEHAESTNNSTEKDTHNNVAAAPLRGRSPQHCDAAGFHLVNVLVHATTCALTVFLFRRIFAGEELPAVTASVLFTVHPVHVEAVAPIVGRADLLCGFLAVAALSLNAGARDRVRKRRRRATNKENEYLTGTLGSGEMDHIYSDGGEEDTRQVDSRKMALDKRGRGLATVRQACTSPGDSLAVEGAPTVGNTSMPSNIATTAPEIAKSVGLTEVEEAAGAAPRPGEEKLLPRASSPPCTIHVSAIGTICAVEKGIDQPNHCDEVTGPGLARFAAALCLAAAATLCKETGVTVFGVMACAEALRFLQNDASLQSIEASSKGESMLEAVPREGELRNPIGVLATFLETSRGYWRRRKLASAWARVFTSTLCAAMMVSLHVGVQKGVAIRRWGVLENDISVLPSRKHRVLSYTYTHAVYASKMVWPYHLCYDWGFRCISHVTSFADPLNVAASALYVIIIATAAFAFARRDITVLWGLALTVVPFIPASNTLFPIGAVVAERLLYLPSLGGCVLASCVLRRHRGDGLRSSTEAHRPAIEASCRTRQYSSDETQRAAAVPEVGVNAHSNCFSSGQLRQHEKESLTLPEQGSSAHHAPARAPVSGINGNIVQPPLSRDPREATMEQISKPRSHDAVSSATSRPPSRMGSKRESVRCTVAFALLMTWVAYFGTRTIRRCEDWMSERNLFESALQLCPQGIKTLNNLAAGMLNPGEAEKAEGLLQKAVELHPGFPYAQFNLGVALRLRGDDTGAITAMERSLALDATNAKVMVYLGQSYLSLAVRSREHQATTNPLDGRAHADIPSNGDDFPTNVSPEMLLSRAESYIAHALRAGSELPLARLVKGDCLVLRRQFQDAADQFQAGIETSLYLLSARGGVGGGGRGRGGMEEVDALDLAAAYNKLGLALREAGTDPHAAKMAFLEGLLVAPDNLALLVNGGAAHHTQGDVQGARALYQQALHLHPTSPELLCNLGWLEESSGGGSRASLETAAEFYDRAFIMVAEESPARGQIAINVANVRRRLETSLGGGD